MTTKLHIMVTVEATHAHTLKITPFVISVERRSTSSPVQSLQHHGHFHFAAFERQKVSRKRIFLGRLTVARYLKLLQPDIAEKDVLVDAMADTSCMSYVYCRDFYDGRRKPRNSNENLQAHPVTIYSEA